MKCFFLRLLLLCIAISPNYSLFGQAKFFYINRSGKYTQIEYDEDWEKMKGNPLLLPYKEGGKYGLVNRKGKKVTTAKYNTASVSEGNYAKVYGEVLANTLVDTNGNEILPLADYEGIEIVSSGTEELIVLQKDGKWSLQRKGGEVLIAPRITRILINSTWIPQLYVLEVDEKKDMEQLYTTAKGPFGEKFFDSRGFNEGMMAVQLKKDGKWGYINTDGVLVIPAKYELAEISSRRGVSFFAGGQAHLLEKDKLVVLDRDGKETAKKYDMVQDNVEGMRGYRLNGKYGYFDGEGKTITEAIYDEAEPFSYGLAKVKQNGLYGYINREGSFAIPVKYKSATSFAYGMAKVTEDNKSHYINVKGDPALGNLAGGEFRDGLAMFLRNGKWGFFDTLGNITIPPQFDAVHSFKYGLAAVKIGEKWGFINTDGFEVVPVKYGTINDFNERGVAWVSLGVDNLDVKAMATAEVEKIKEEERKRYAALQPPPPDPNACTKCDGSGYESEGGSTNCRSCWGNGSRQCNSCSGGYRYNYKGESSYCPYCRGAGTISCSSCFGSGTKETRGKLCSTCKGSGRKPDAK